MTNVIYIAKYLEKRREQQTDIEAFFSEHITLSGKLQLVADKMCQELLDSVGPIPAATVAQNEKMMQYIASVHDDELDNGYHSVCEIVDDLVCYQCEVHEDNEVESSTSYISVR